MPLTPKLVAELAALEMAPDETIDTSDIPEQTDWSGAVRGRFNRPANWAVIATFSIWSDVLTPQEITVALGVTPTRTVLKGPERGPPRIVPRSYGWHVSVDDTTPCIEHALRMLLDRLGPPGRLGGFVAETKDIYAKFSFIVRAADVQSVAFFFPSDLVGEIAKIPHQLDFGFEV